MDAMFENNPLLREDSQKVHAFLISHEDVMLTDADSGAEVRLPAQAVKALIAATEMLSRPEVGAISLDTLPAVMITPQVATFLGLSRPDVIQLVKDGELAAKERNGTLHFRTSDVLAHREVILNRRREAFNELLDLDAQFGL